MKVICAFAAVLFSAAAATGENGTIRARAVFIGDIMVHEQQLDAARYGASWDFKPHFRRVKPLFRESLAVGNLETVFAGENKKFSGYPAFNTPDELADALSDLGVNIVMLANNHILDKGLDAAARTTRVLDDEGILWAGVASPDAPDEPLVVEYAGLKWAFVNYTYGSNMPVKPSVSGDLALNVISDGAIVSGLARAGAYEPDITVAFFHWGLEYKHSPTKSQRRTAALSLANSADIVIGAHPHVLQPVEVASSDRGYAAVAYSLGNFVSFQRTKPRERSVILAIDVEKAPGGRAGISRVSVAPTWVSARNQAGRRAVEVVYAGTGGQFNHAGLPAVELAAARSAGGLALEYLGAAKEPDEDGFYTLWESASPDIIPESGRKSPE
jgi:poly-gamma-glutamate synthesis protein (capsule biosynthesis protein)